MNDIWWWYLGSLVYKWYLMVVPEVTSIVMNGIWWGI